MPEQAVGLITQLTDLIKYAVVAVLSFFGWALKRQITRIDKLEEVIVPESSLDKTINRFTDSVDKGFKDIKSDMHVMHTQTRLDIREIHKRIDGIMKK